MILPRLLEPGKGGPARLSPDGLGSESVSWMRLSAGTRERCSVLGAFSEMAWSLCHYISLIWVWSKLVGDGPTSRRQRAIAVCIALGNAPYRNTIIALHLLSAIDTRKATKAPCDGRAEAVAT